MSAAWSREASATNSLAAAADPAFQMWYLISPVLFNTSAVSIDRAAETIVPWSLFYIATGAFLLWRAKARLRKDLF